MTTEFMNTWHEPIFQMDFFFIRIFFQERQVQTKIIIIEVQINRVLLKFQFVQLNK